MERIADASHYRIQPGTLSVALNVLGDANRVQCGVIGGATMKCFIDDIEELGYDSNHQYQEYPIAIASTYFNTDTEKYVYAAFPKDQPKVATAMIVFPSEIIDVYGRNASEEQIGPEDYLYIWLQGIISAVITEDGVSRREMTQEIDYGLLGTDYAQARRIIGMSVNGQTIEVAENHTVSLVIPEKMSQLANDSGFIDDSEVTSPGAEKAKIGGKVFQFGHNHDWGEIANKPNLLEGIVVGQGKLSFRFSNGDMVTADFTGLLTAMYGQRGMVVNPYVWAASYNPDNEDWTGRMGDHWFDSTNDILYICTAGGASPEFSPLRGTYLLWHEQAGELLLYQNYGTPSTIVLHTT